MHNDHCMFLVAQINVIYIFFKITYKRVWESILAYIYPNCQAVLKEIAGFRMVGKAQFLNIQYYTV